jgi:hypothetical protein
VVDATRAQHRIADDRAIFILGDTVPDLACELLDRGLRDRPGALRLVGVGVSGLTTVRQLTLDEL